MLLKYAERRMLPGRRLQLQVARVAQYVHGDATKPLSYYDILTPPAPVLEDDAEEIGSMFAAVTGGNVIRLGQGRKRKVN